MQVLSDHKMTGNWFIKYKLYHIPFWFLYNYFGWVIAIGNPVTAAHDILFTPFFVKFSFYVVFPALAVYFNFYFLIPRYLQKGKYATYLAYLLLTIFCTSILIIPGYYLTAYLSGKTVQELYGGGANCYYQFFGNAMPATIASITLAMSIKLTKNWLQTQRRQQLLEKEKLETELQFLKNQFNPHYLFNTINSIFFLIHKNPDIASASLAKFSELLRYQLYECNDLQIALQKEINYMENFLELEKLRQNSNMEVTLNMSNLQSGQWGIAPFILMTFVENAFKHVSKNTDTRNWITITAAIHQGQLDFTVANSTSLFAVSEVIHYGGIGLQNVQRRLDLIYPGRYDLGITKSTDSFEAKLRLYLTELESSLSVKKTA